MEKESTASKAILAEGTAIKGLAYYELRVYTFKDERQQKLIGGN